MHRFTKETLDLLFTEKILARAAKHLDVVGIGPKRIRQAIKQTSSEEDKKELERVLAEKERRDLDKANCSKCKESLAGPHGCVCHSYYHDFDLCLDPGCISCYFNRVGKDQLNLVLFVDV